MYLSNAWSTRPGIPSGLVSNYNMYFNSRSVPSRSSICFANRVARNDTISAATHLGSKLQGPNQIQVFSMLYNPQFLKELAPLLRQYD